MPENYTNSNQFLNGKGIMKQFYREKDWSKHPLGITEMWPQCLKTTLSIILNSDLPSVLFWDSNLFCFYNDAYRAQFDLESKKIQSVSTIDFSYWNKIIGTIKPILNDVLENGQSNSNKNLLLTSIKNGKITDTFWDLNFIPIYNESGKTAGVFTTFHSNLQNDSQSSALLSTTSEISKQEFSRIKLEESEQKTRALVENAPFAIAVYTGEEMRIELANEAIINIWGKGNDVIGKTFTEILPELAEQSVFEQIKEVYKSGTAFHTENTPLQLVVNGVKSTYYFNYSFTPLFDLSGKIYGVLNTGVDLTDLNIAKKKIENSDKRFRNTVRQAPTAIAIFRGENYVTEMANDACLEMAGRSEQQLLNQPLFDVIPEVKDDIKPLFDSVLETGIPYFSNTMKIPLMRNNMLKTLFFDVVFSPLKDEDGSTDGIIVTAVEVTERVISRKKIEQNEERLKIVLEASELGTWELNVVTKEVLYSERFLAIIGGYTDTVTLDQNLLVEHIHPEDLEIRKKAFEQALISGNLIYSVRVIWPNKSLHWMEVKGKVFYNENNDPHKIIGTIRDTTKEHQDQQLLIENEKKFRLLSDSMPQHIWTSDVGGTQNYFNKSFIEYSGLSLQQLLDVGWLDIVHPDDKEENAKLWLEAIATGNDFLVEHRFRKHDGTYRWQLSRAIPQRDENGTIQMWVGSSTDIQQQKTFAQELEKQVSERTRELKELNQTLKKSEERYHLMVGEVQDYAILYLSKDGIVENWNKGAEKIKGYKASEIIGKNFALFYTDKDRETNLPKELLNKALQDGRFSQEGWRVRKDGSKFWASVVITAVHDHENEVIGFSKVTHDLTSKKEADDKIKRNAAQLEQKNIELEKMNKELQSFAYISSHDLQEPLRKIQTFSNQIVEREFDNLSENGKDKFQRMQNAAKRMQTLINDLLAYSRSSTNDIKLIKTDLNTIFNDVKEDLKEELQQKNAVLIIENLKCEAAIIPFQIHQLLYNLISNSIKFSREEVPPLISVICEIKKGNKLNNKQLIAEVDYCHITLSDNGIGFNQQYNEKIFEVFQRLHGRESYQGTGIGLAIVKKIIENHNGIITATGAENKGATFNIYLPINVQK